MSGSSSAITTGSGLSTRGRPARNSLPQGPFLCRTRGSEKEDRQTDLTERETVVYLRRWPIQRGHPIACRAGRPRPIVAEEGGPDRMDSKCDSRGRRPNNARGLGAERIELSTPRLKGMFAIHLVDWEFSRSACLPDS